MTLLLLCGVGVLGALAWVEHLGLRRERARRLEAELDRCLRRGRR